MGGERSLTGRCCQKLLVLKNPVSPHPYSLVSTAFCPTSSLPRRDNLDRSRLCSFFVLNIYMHMYVCLCVFMIRVIQTTYRKLKKIQKDERKRKKLPLVPSFGEVGGSTRRAFCEHHFFLFKELLTQGFPGGLVVRMPGFHCLGPGSIAGWGTEIPQAARCSQKKTREMPRASYAAPRVSRALTQRFGSGGRGVGGWVGPALPTLTVARVFSGGLSSLSV